MAQEAARVKGFDGIRGLAAVAVMLHHTWIGSRNLGGIPVNVFFVLSGFLICGILHSARLRIEDRQSTVRTELFHFWVNRGLRVLPLYYVAIVLTALAGIVLGTFTDLVTNFTWYVFYLQNLLMAFVTRQFGSVGHMWTLAVEQQFYIIFGAVMLLVPAKRHLALLFLASLMALSSGLWAMSTLPFPAKFILPMTGFVPIICGGLVSVAISRTGIALSQNSNSILALVCCAVLAGLSLLPANQTFIPAFDAVALIGSSIFSSILFLEITRNQRGIVTRFLDLPTFRWLGDLSYGIYIIHGVVREMTLARFHMFSSPKTFAVVALVTLVLAQASRTLIELPALRLKYRAKLFVPSVMHSGATAG